MPLSETVLILMGLLAAGMVTAGLFRRLPVPYTVLLVLIGVGLEALASRWEPLHPLLAFRLTPELVLFIFLPTLIFESGFNLNARQLIKDIAPVLVLAVPALLFSTAFVGVGLWLALPTGLGIALVFGALISATDPVAVVALFKELGTPERLTVLVEGESLLNDATAIVVFNILLGLALYGSVGWGDAGLAVLEFFKVFLGGALVGAVFGLAGGWLMNRLQAGTSATVILSLVLAYTGFILAEHALHVSGVMTVAAAAVTLGSVAVPRLPRETGQVLGETWEFLAMVANTLLFLLVGLSIDLGTLYTQVGAILLVVVLLLVARAAMIYTLVPMTTRIFRLPRVSLGDQHIMWWGGLKGGLAIAVVLSIPEDLPGRQLLVNLTLGTVLFTLLVNAPTVRPLIRLLGLNRMSEEETNEMWRSAGLARTRADRRLRQFREAGLVSRATLHRVRQALRAALKAGGGAITDARRQLRLDALRVELEALEDLYKAGVIPNYTFLDLRSELVRARESVSGHTLAVDSRARRQRNPFLRLEDALIRRIRERDWATGLLVRYQNLRIEQHLYADIARILMTEAALEQVRNDPGIGREDRDTLASHYRERMAGYRARIAETRRDFPHFYQRFEHRLALRAALAAAERSIESQQRQGLLGGKPAGVLLRGLREVRLPSLARPVPALAARELLSLVPLFQGLSGAALERVAERARTLRFLPGDTVIGEGERGDALYLVAQGHLSVTRRGDNGKESELGQLGAGEFFGETALLGEQVRTATVRAVQASTLLRLTRREVIEIAGEHPEVGERLREAQQLRSVAAPEEG